MFPGMYIIPFYMHADLWRFKFHISQQISTCITCWYHVINISITSSTAQGGGGSFKNRKPIGEIGCCESGMAERIHWWTERCLRSPLFLSLSLLTLVPSINDAFIPPHPPNQTRNGWFPASMCADDRSLCADDDAVSLCADDSFAMCADDSLSMCADDALTPIYLSTYLSTFLSFYLSVYLSTCLCVVQCHSV